MHTHTHTLIHVHAPYVPPAHRTDDVFVLGRAVRVHVLECFYVKLLPAELRVGNEAFVVPQVHHFLAVFPLPVLLVERRTATRVHDFRLIGRFGLFG